MGCVRIGGTIAISMDTPRYQHPVPGSRIGNVPTRLTVCVDGKLYYTYRTCVIIDDYPSLPVLSAERQQRLSHWQPRRQLYSLLERK
jgi:hypothetical protein